MLEKKKKRKEQKKILNEMKQRQSKRLWEAQSIQRKLDEVEVKMSELDQLANQVEKQLRSGDGRFYVLVHVCCIYYSALKFLYISANQVEKKSCKLETLFLCMHVVSIIQPKVHPIIIFGIRSRIKLEARRKCCNVNGEECLQKAHDNI